MATIGGVVRRHAVQPGAQRLPHRVVAALGRLTASGGIGWAVPAAVGVALADRDRGVSRPVDVETAEDLEREFKAALSAETTTVIVVPTQPQRAML